MDTRIGLIHNRATAKKYETQKRAEELNSKNRQVSLKDLERKNREEALTKSTLVPSNKGFNLMLKMGYKSGEALGKSSSSSESQTATKQQHRIVEPIQVQIKSDRVGFGQAEERKRKLEEIEHFQRNRAERRVQVEKRSVESYLDTKRYKFQMRKMLHNLHKCQRICFQLDSNCADVVRYNDYRLFSPLFSQK